jgi:hypothetical protein
MTQRERNGVECPGHKQVALTPRGSQNSHTSFYNPFRWTIWDFPLQLWAPDTGTKPYCGFVRQGGIFTGIMASGVMRKNKGALVLYLIVSLLVDSAALPVAPGRVILSSENSATSSSASDVDAAAELLLRDKGYASVSNSASSELAVIAGDVDAPGSSSGSSSTGSSSSSSESSSSSSSSSSAAFAVGAVGFNVVLGAPPGGGFAGRKMLQSSDDVTYINAFLVDLAEALGVPRTALTATSFTGTVRRIVHE